MSWWKRGAKEIQNLPRPQRPLNYPSHLFVETEDGSIYYVLEKTKFRVYSERCWRSWNTTAVRGSDMSLSKYILGPPVGFRNGTLIHNIADGRMYLISESKTRHITTPDLFDVYGLRREEMITVSADEVNVHKEGEPIV